MPPPKRERLAEFMRRLLAAPAAQTYEEARRQLTDILNAVEDEMTDIPFHPSASQSDGRIYPPHDDFERDAGHPGLRRFRSVAHSTVFGSNGSIRIVAVPSRPSQGWTEGTVVLDKPGLDGRRIEDL